MLKYNGRIITKNDRWLSNPPEPPSFDEVTIGMYTWTAKNVAIDDGGDGIYTFQVSYDGGQTYVTEYYYTHDAAIRISAQQEGWYLATNNNWNYLINYIGGNDNGYKLKSTYGWSDNGNGTDEYGFNALPAGYVRDGSLILPNSYCSLWSASSATPWVSSWTASLISVSPSISLGKVNDTDANPIRLIKSRGT